jgi:hypothetical protein
MTDYDLLVIVDYRDWIVTKCLVFYGNFFSSFGEVRTCTLERVAVHSLFSLVFVYALHLFPRFPRFHGISLRTPPTNSVFIFLSSFIVTPLRTSTTKDILSVAIAISAIHSFVFYIIVDRSLSTALIIPSEKGVKRRSFISNFSTGIPIPSNRLQNRATT